MKIILTGATGLIGSRFEEIMFERHEIIPLSSKDTDIVNDSSVCNFFEGKSSDIVIHLAAKTDVDGCEADKEEDQRLIKSQIGEQTSIEKMDWKPYRWFTTRQRNSAFAVNFIGTSNLYNEARNRGIKFIYISTDFVFDGNGKYDEESKPDPINWYGMTKWYGERLIDTSKDLIVRLSYPYGYPSPVKPDFVQKLMSLLSEVDEVSLIEDQTITPTFIDDIVQGLDFLLKKNATGIYHLTGDSYEDPYHMGQMIKEKMGLKTSILPSTRAEVYHNRAPRPFQSIMKNDKLKGLDFRPRSFKEGLELII